MPKAKGVTYLELLISLAIFGVIAAIAVPSLLRAKQWEDRKILFGEHMRNLSLPLTPAQIEVLRPLVDERITTVCTSPAAVPPLPPGTTDRTLIQNQLDKLAELERGPSPDCVRIRAIAAKEGF